MVRKKAKKAAINANNGDSGEVADENSSQLIIPTITREERSYQPGICCVCTYVCVFVCVYVCMYVCQAWGQIHEYLYLAVFKYYF